MRQRTIIFLSVIAFVSVLAFLFIKSVQMEKEKDSGLTVPSNEPLLEVSDPDWIKGKKDAKVVVVEYSDLQCPACAAYYPLTKELLKLYGEQIGFVYRHFPLRNIHSNAQISAQVAEAAGVQGKFWEMHDLLFERQAKWAEEKDPKPLFEGYAKELGLNVEQFKTDLESEKVASEVENDFQSGLKSGVNATPTFFINGKKIQNPRTFEEFKSIIEKEIGK